MESSKPTMPMSNLGGYSIFLGLCLLASNRLFNIGPQSSRAPGTLMVGYPRGISPSSGIEITESRGDDDVFPSSSFLGEYVSLEECEFQTQDATNGLTLFSDESCPKARFTFHY